MKCKYCENTDALMVYPNGKIICTSCDHDEWDSDPAGDTYWSQGIPVHHFKEKDE